MDLVDGVATHDKETGRSAIFLVNRSQTDEVTVTMDVAALAAVKVHGAVNVLSAQTLSDADVYAKNTLDNPERVGLSPNESVVAADGAITITLPAVSWTAVALG